MQDLTLEREPEESDKLIINLTQTPSGVVTVRSVEVLDRMSRVRFSFKPETTLRDVFTAQAFDVVQTLVDRIGETRALTLPDFMADMKDLLLRGARIFCSEATKSGAAIMIRFKRFFGRVRSLFSERVSQRDAFADEAVDFALQAVERAYLPLQNFGCYVDELLRCQPSSLDSGCRAFLQRIRREIDNLSFASDMAVLYVNASDPRGVASADDALEMRMLRQLQLEKRTIADSLVRPPARNKSSAA
ncbi:MAG: hypothetical protein AAF334_06695 [Pseudomonadota bacterium]